MAFAKTWNNDFHIKPTGSDLLGQVDNFIVETRQAIEERVNLEHQFDRAVNAEQGSHRQGSARVWVSETEPTSPVPGSTNTGAVTDLNVGRLWIVVNGSGVPTGEIKVHDGTSWVSCGSFAAAALLTAIKTVDGAGSGLDADLLDGMTSATANTANTIVARDASGNFSAGTITANITGNVTGNVTGTTTNATLAVTANHIPTSQPDSSNGAIWVV